jgi:hypothetical protein
MLMNLLDQGFPIPMGLVFVLLPSCALGSVPSMLASKVNPSNSSLSKISAAFCLVSVQHTERISIQVVSDVL